MGIQNQDRILPYCLYNIFMT